MSSPSSNLCYDWYDVSSGGTILASSTNITTPIIVNSINYYVESRTISTGCKSDSRFLAKAIVLPLPNPPVSIGNNTRCGPGDILLKVSANAEYSMDWYSASSGGLPVKTNSDFLKLVNISTSNSFYVSSRDIVTGCTSSIRSKITANVLPILPAPSTLTGTANICPYVGTNNSLLYAASQVQGALNYFWTIPTGASIDSGNIGLKVKLRYQFASPNDSLIVQANNGCLGLKKSLKLYTSNCFSSALKYQNEDLKKSSEYELRIYPNPAEVDFRGVITSITKEMVYLNVYNIQGKRIKSFLVYPNIEFNFGKDLPPGMYLVEYGKKYQKNWIKVVKVN